MITSFIISMVYNGYEGVFSLV